MERSKGKLSFFLTKSLNLFQESRSFSMGGNLLADLPHPLSVEKFLHGIHAVLTVGLYICTADVWKKKYDFLSESEHFYT